MDAIDLLREYCNIFRDCFACRWNEYNYLGQDDDDDVYQEMVDVDNTTDSNRQDSVGESNVGKKYVAPEIEGINRDGLESVDDQNSDSVSLLGNSMDNNVEVAKVGDQGKECKGEDISVVDNESLMMIASIVDEHGKNVPLLGNEMINKTLHEETNIYGKEMYGSGQLGHGYILTT